MWYRRTTEYYSALKKGNPAIGNSMEEPRGHCAEENQSVTEGQILHDSSYMRYGTHRSREENGGCRGRGEQEGELFFNRDKVAVTQDE